VIRGDSHECFDTSSERSRHPGQLLGRKRADDRRWHCLGHQRHRRPALGKDAFLQLLVTQLKNQNPLDPQDNGAFVAQLAQFSSLEGITTLNDTSARLAGNYNSSQACRLRRW
jgi:flagellar hook assembly protein FlgD